MNFLATIGKYLAQWLLLPLLKEGAAYIVEWFRLRKLKKESDRKVDNDVEKYEDAKTKEDVVDSINDINL